MGRYVVETYVHLDPITDLEMLAMIDKQKQGGMCFVGSKRRSKANRHYILDYDPKQAEHYNLYEDANNLYACALVQLLPYKGLKFEHMIELDTILKTPDNSVTGQTVQVDFEFPVELNGKFKAYPPAPESTVFVAILFFRLPSGSSS